MRRKHHLEAQLAQTVSQLDQIHSNSLGQNKENSRNHGANIDSISVLKSCRNPLTSRSSNVDFLDHLELERAVSGEDNKGKGKGRHNTRIIIRKNG